MLFLTQWSQLVHPSVSQDTPPYTVAVIASFLRLPYSPPSHSSCFVLYVKPTEFTLSWHGEPCHTLDEYAQNVSQYRYDGGILTWGSQSVSATQYQWHQQPVFGCQKCHKEWSCHRGIWHFMYLQLNFNRFTGTMTVYSCMGSKVCMLHLKLSYDVILQSVSSTVTCPPVGA